MPDVGSTGEHTCPSCLKRRQNSRLSSKRHYNKNRQVILKGKFLKYHEKKEKTNQRGNSAGDQEGGSTEERGTSSERTGARLSSSSEEESESGGER